MKTSPEKLAYNAEYRKNNKEKIKAGQRDFYQRNREKVKARVRVYAKENKESIRLSHLKNYAKTIAYRMLYEARKRSKKFGLPFNLDLSDISIPDVCPVLGIPIIIGSSVGPSNNSPSLDKVVPSLGYVKGNVSIISWRANRLKSDATLEELRDIVTYVEKETR